MKLTRERIVGFIVLGLGMALLLFVAWPQSLNIVRSIYHSDNLGKQKHEHNSLYDNVETFVLFVGQPRSSHSLIAAILDSHPEMIIPNEFHLLAKFKDFFKDKNEDSYSRRFRIFSELHSLSHNQAMEGKRSPNHKGGYSYHIPGSWQGKYRNQIKVIGDKRGGGTTAILGTPKGLRHLKKLQKTVVVPVKLIHVIRNPFDNIATRCLRKLEQRKPSDQHKVNNGPVLDTSIQTYFRNVQTVQKLHDMSKYPILDVYSRDMIAKPRETLHKLCNFLSVTCYNEFVDLTLKMLYSKPSKTRYSVEWTKEQKERVTNEISKYQFLKSQFSFDSD